MDDIDVIIGVGAATAVVGLLLSGPLRNILLISGIVVALLGILRRLTER